MKEQISVCYYNTTDDSYIETFDIITNIKGIILYQDINFNFSKDSDIGYFVKFSLREGEEGLKVIIFEDKEIIIYSIKNHDKVYLLNLLNIYKDVNNIE